MKLRGEFVVRQVLDNIVAIPVGETALRFSGMILLNDVSKVIWECLERGSDQPAIVSAVTEAFEVSREEAETDAIEFLSRLNQAGLLEE